MPRLLALSGDLVEYKLEIVFVDDGSTDGSREILEELSSKNRSCVRVVLLTRNFGQSAAIQAGLRFATGHCIGIISCDLQEPCEQFVTMVKMWEKGHKFVIGERVERNEGRMHRTVSAIYWQLIRRHAFKDFPPMGYDFCIFDRRIALELNEINEKNTSVFVLIYWLGYRPVSVPIVRQVRTLGTSQWTFFRKLKFTLDTLIGFTYLPARMISLAGFGTATVAILYLVLIMVRWAVIRAAPPGWMTVVGLVIVFGALNLFAVGILSEYLLRILDEARKRPPFIVERIINPSSVSGDS